MVLDRFPLMQEFAWEAVQSLQWHSSKQEFDRGALNAWRVPPSTLLKRSLPSNARHRNRHGVSAKYARKIRLQLLRHFPPLSTVLAMKRSSSLAGAVSPPPLKRKVESTATSETNPTNDFLFLYIYSLTTLFPKNRIVCRLILHPDITEKARKSVMADRQQKPHCR